MVGYADDCERPDEYDVAVRKRWAATANDPAEFSKIITDFLTSPVYKTLLRYPASASAGSSSSSSGGRKRDSSSAFGGAPRATSSTGHSAGARGGKGSGKGRSKKPTGGGGGPVTSE